MMPPSRLKRSSETVVPVIVSLTSIPSRLGTLHLVIRSLLTQDVSPKRIVLWLHKDLQPSLPNKLQKLECQRFEIRYSDLTCSHRKLIHSLEAFPDDVIITCDDDLMYRKNWLSLFFEEHQQNPENIIGNYTVHINHDPEGNPMPFKTWRQPLGNVINPWALTPIGAWGVLYPPDSLSEQVQDVEAFMELAPRADDLWFKAMALLKGTISVQSAQTPKEPIPIGGTQKVALKKENLGADKNTLQSKAFDNVFVIGDATNLPTSKAGSVAHFEADVLHENLLAKIEGRPFTASFDGHANCYIETGYGKGTLIDFNYDTEPLPGSFPFPGLGPFGLLKESRMNHYGKLLFRWIYWHILIKGREMPISSQMTMAGKKF